MLKELRAIDPAVDIPDDKEDMRLADYMKHELGGKPVIADRLHIGPLALIVRDADAEHNIISIGVWREPAGERTRPLLHGLFRFLGRMRRKMRR